MSLNGSRKRLLLSRITTVELDEKSNINIDAIIKLSKDRARPADEIVVTTDLSTKVVKNKKMRLIANRNEPSVDDSTNNGDSTSNNSTGYLIIDATQITEATSTTTTSSTKSPIFSSQPLPSLPAIPATSILDPPTRCMDRGITIAMKTCDFNEVAAALILGANANYQQRSGELRTALVIESADIILYRKIILLFIEIS